MSQPISKLAICRGLCVQYMCLVKDHVSHELVLSLCFFSSMNWQGHEVWIQVLLLVLMGQQGLGEGRPEGHSSRQLPHLLLGLVGDLHPVPGRGTVEMVLIHCLNPRFQVGVACGEFQLRGGGIG